MISRVASIDVGTNAIRFQAADVDEGGILRVLAETRIPVRFGHGVFSAGRLAPEAMEAAVEGIGTAVESATSLGVQRIRAVATSAVRESPNRAELLRAVRRRTGLTLELIAGTEEIRLVHLAVRKRVDLGAGSWLLAELGGGSLEVALVDAERVQWSETYSMGAVRLLELFAPGGDEPAGYAALVAEYVAALRLPEELMSEPRSGLIGTGGNVEALSRMVGPTARARGPARIAAADLAALVPRLSRMDPAERASAFQLRSDRADVVLPAAIVYARLATLAGADTIVVPGGGVREGILLDLARDPRRRREPVGDSFMNAVLALGSKYSFDKPHALHVARFSGQLFDALASLHHLGARDRRLLLAAATLHDIGGFVNMKGHHKHTLYLVSHAELPGFSPAEMRLVGTVARYHRKGPPSVAHAEFAALPAADRERVRRLSALLRVADALDREHRGKVTAIEVRARPDVVEIAVRAEGDILLERWSLARKIDAFREVFGVEVTLTVG